MKDATGGGMDDEKGVARPTHGIAHPFSSRTRVRGLPCSLFEYSYLPSVPCPPAILLLSPSQLKGIFRKLSVPGYARPRARGLPTLFIVVNVLHYLLFGFEISRIIARKHRTHARAPSDASSPLLVTLVQYTQHGL